ncbi:hypothetical protein [Planotetraspora sp. GP83]|uniref:hypothetical protein n=1 Tax=Planotetraspora sp. GP83 TaxID=3156264 RepID=UPI003515815A
MIDITWAARPGMRTTGYLRRRIVIVLLLALAYYGTLELPSPYNMSLITAIPFGLAIGTFAAANVRGERTVLGSRPMVWLGNYLVRLLHDAGRRALLAAPGGAGR